MLQLSALMPDSYDRLAAASVYLHAQATLLAATPEHTRQLLTEGADAWARLATEHPDAYREITQIAATRSAESAIVAHGSPI
jgi:hypothetical protein